MLPYIFHNAKRFNVTEWVIIALGIATAILGIIGGIILDNPAYMAGHGALGVCLVQQAVISADVWRAKKCVCCVVP